MGYNPTGLTGQKHSQIYERVPSYIDGEFKILTYGLNNLYPQEVEQIRLASPLVKSSTEVLEDFLNGTGFESNQDTEVNRFAETYNDILNLVAKDAARFSGAFALLVNFDGTGQGVELQHIPFQYVRMKEPNKAGRVTMVMVSDNWERSDNKPDLKPKEYRLLNPLTAQEDAVRNGRGQVLYYTGVEKGLYPLATFDSILSVAITDNNVQQYTANNVAKGFHGANIIKYPAIIETEQEKFVIKQKIDELLGINGSGALVVSVDDDFNSNIIETVPANDTSDLFDTTITQMKNSVLQVFKQPPALMGIAPEGGVFTQLAYQESYIVYNVITRNGRKAIAKAINKVAALFGEDLGQIKENKFLVEGQELVPQEQTQQNG